MGFGGAIGGAIGTIGGMAEGLGRGFTGANQQDAINKAAELQLQGTQETLAQQQAQWEQAQQWMAPYMQAGNQGLQGMMSMSGLNGPEAEAAMMAGVENSPYFQALVGQGEQGMLQNASATGGMRGGNMQGALAQYRPAMLKAEIENKYNKLAGITNLGQSTTVGGVAAGAQSSAAMANTIMGGAEGQANAAMAMGGAQDTMFNNLMQGGTAAMFAFA
jgi:hypothetical protein